VEYLNMSLLQIYQWVYQWKNFENRLTFGEVMGKSLVSCFFDESTKMFNGIDQKLLAFPNFHWNTEGLYNATIYDNVMGYELLVNK